jgi:RNA recognition motif-containing protein
VYFGNLPYSFDETDMRALLSENDFTPVGIFLLKDKVTTNFKGVSFVEFSSLDDAAKAIGSLNGVDYKGRRLKVQPADPYNKG